MNYKSISLVLGFCLLTAVYSIGQTLIINEVSNGELGNQEYVELVVMDDNVTYNCGDTEPPCIDIRGWIFDDNSGYHGAGGAASGCLRFSFDPMWQCVPVGTIIVLYNDDDYSTSLIPSPDISMVDGNCKIVAPISNTALFESNATTPGDVACSYPAAGWTAGGNWNNVLFRNAGDCARIVDLSGCEVFSVCWGDNDQNTLIYFEDGIDVGAGSATNTVFYFNNGDPTNQANWSVGCADEPNCGVQDQTPGVANNVDNEAYIAQFNNGCQPITPVVANAVVDQDAICGCTGQATASGSGSIPGYTYEWLDATDNPIGQNTATATGLCDGTYKVVVTSSIGCDDTTEVTLVASGSVSVVVEDEQGCEGDLVTLIATPSQAGGTYSWSPGGETTSSITVTANSTTIYTVTYTLGTCSNSDDATLTVVPNPTADFLIDPSSEFAPSEVTFTNTSSNATDYTWDFGNGATSASGAGSLTSTYDTSGVYTVTLVASSGPCTDLVSYTFSLLEAIEPIIHVPNVFSPNGDNVNEIYTIQTQFVTAMEGVILNRWGNVILEFDEVDFEWNGKINGNDAPDGVYFIRYSATGLNEQTYEGHTFFELIR